MRCPAVPHRRPGAKPVRFLQEVRVPVNQRAVVNYFNFEPVTKRLFQLEVPGALLRV